jgi:hypothetical protein
MWLRLLWQLKELLPLLSRLLPLLEGWVGGVGGASAANAATSRALRQLEARVGSTQEGLEGQLRDQGTVLVHLTKELKDLRAQVAASERRQEEQAARLAEEIATVQRVQKIAALQWLMLVLMLGVVVMLLVRMAWMHHGS